MIYAATYRASLTKIVEGSNIAFEQLGPFRACHFFFKTLPVSLVFGSDTAVMEPFDYANHFKHSDIVFGNDTKKKTMEKFNKT